MNPVEHPGLLDLFARVGSSHGFNRRHLTRTDGPDWKDAGADRPAIEVHRAGAALRDAATELCAGQPHDIPQDPEKRHVWRDVQLVRTAINQKIYHKTPKTLLSAMINAARQV